MAAIPPPAPKLNRSQNKFDLQTALVPFKRREWVISEIGKDNLAGFELWAFPKLQHDMIYDDEIAFHWANSHSTKGVGQDPDLAIQEIVSIWKARFMSREASSSEDEYVFPIQLCHEEDKEWPETDFGD